MMPAERIARATQHEIFHFAEPMAGREMVRPRLAGHPLCRGRGPGDGQAGIDSPAIGAMTGPGGGDLTTGRCGRGLEALPRAMASQVRIARVVLVEPLQRFLNLVVRSLQGVGHFVAQ